jgi:hypothetical protein
MRANWDNAIGAARREGTLLSLGDAKSLETGFEYRGIAGLDVQERSGSW